MSLLNIFSGLSIPDTTNPKIFNVLTLNECPFAKLGVNSEGFPVVLISSMTDRTYLSQKNVRLQYLELTHNLECKVSENDITRYENFTVIIFRSNQQSLQHYFLGIAETLVKSLSKKPTQQEVSQTFKNFVEIFRSLTDIPTKTVHGLWSELFIIDSSKDPATLLNYWHNIPTEKFDFNADTEKLEVKSSGSLERVHIFASEQLNPPPDKQVIIASLFVRQATNGRSILQLAESIQQKVENNDLVQKLFSIVSKTLANAVEQSIRIRFDYDLALNSLRFYCHQDIQKIEKINIPTRVSEVRFKSDLTELKSVSMPNFTNEGMLFKAI